MKFAAALVCSLLAVSPAAAQTATPIRMEGYPAPGEPSKFTLISAGANPSKMQQVIPAAGYKEHMEMAMTMGMAMEMAGMQMPAVTAPTMKMGFDLQVTDVAANGDVTMSMVGTGVTANDAGASVPMFAEVVKETDRQIKTFKGSVTVGRDGNIVKQEMDLSGLKGTGGADAVAQLRDSLRDMRPELPKDGFGVGAKWEIRTATNNAGSGVSFQKMNYEVVARDAESATIKSTIEQTSPPQKITNDAMPPGAEMHLESGTGSGSGTIRLNVNRLVPAIDMAIKMNMKMVVSMQGQTQPMGMAMDIKMTTTGTVIK